MKAPVMHCSAEAPAVPRALERECFEVHGQEIGDQAPDAPVANVPLSRPLCGATDETVARVLEQDEAEPRLPGARRCCSRRKLRDLDIGNSDSLPGSVVNALPTLVGR
jgi:hypothetical protein